MNVIRIRAVMTRHWIVLRRSPHRWFEISFWPVMDVVLWGSLGAFLAKQASSGELTTKSALAGLTMFWMFTQAQFAVSLGVNEETWTRNVLNVMTTPIREIEYLVGIAVFGLLKMVLCLAVLTVTTMVLFDAHIGQIGWWVIPITALLLVNGWALGMFAVGLVVRFGQSAEILIWGLNYVFLSVTGVFFPVSAIPGFFRVLGRVVPPSAVYEQVRNAVTSGNVSGSALTRAAFGSIVFLALTTLFATRQLHTFRRRGYVTRYS